MFDNIEVKESAEVSVKKLIMKNESAMAETVLYKYPTYLDRTVICASTMSGCPIGCRFCGAGDFFARNLTADEIVQQVDVALELAMEDSPNSSVDDIERLQIMVMSMGEPLLNKKGLVASFEELYAKYPHAALLISTVGPDINYQWVNELSQQIPTIGLQFSIHKSTDEARNELIPFKKKLNLKQISKAGKSWYEATGRKPFFNYCASHDNSSSEDASRLATLFPPHIWEATVSVICERNDGLPAKSDAQVTLANTFSAKLLNHSFNVRVFDPAGQDDIGGGCGQLFAVQKWAQENEVKKSIGAQFDAVHVPE